MLSTGYSNEYFVKGALTFSIFTMLLMTSMISIFAPAMSDSEGYENEINDLLGEYYSMTGSTVQNEQIWGLTGIYTPYGIGSDGSNSTGYIELNDGWVAGSRIESYSPSQYKGDSGLNKGKSGYTVTYDKEKGLYYYTAHGTDLVDIEDSNFSTNPKTYGTLYTSVTMDQTQKSNQFFTVGTKKQLENGTFYYNFTGYRYCFQSLSDYYYNQSTPITHTDTSLSLIWYQYTGDSGLSGQLVLSGSDSGVAYITASQIVSAFNSANYTSKFVMNFNGIDMNIYIKLNVYAITHGYSVEDCYNNGFWSVLVTSPSMADESDKGSMFDSFDPMRLAEITFDLLTFKGDEYGLTGTAGAIASSIFSISLYTSLIAIGLAVWPVLILAGILAVIQTFSIADLWPF